ncbi:MAG TPA: efflux RND transporter periplasmic adaptor subunit [Verrucomicrobiota bacterium]|nr:efflux RND transporter periplasmic adaptor subunit [Verrucomicrobiota bacterium]HOR70978.1 efflux RND transporter periplasmic adaptor subunit [Verrucomicrobiota bacterium]HPK97543.1 efflux RND transporter periplasmic adaptor subunit [Verrucomicrobiota bacterium]HQK00060.1 efflux RND transporter periplasmic adaptor subunit [Verrucomicrobiota bacterium]
MSKLATREANSLAKESEDGGKARTTMSDKPRVSSLSRTVLLGLLGCGVSLTGCGRPQQARPPAGMPEVAVVTVTNRPIVLTTEMPGLTSPYLISDVRPQVNGLVLKRLFIEGSDVKQGQQLYQIDPAPFQAALDNATAALGRAEASLPALRSRVDRFRQALADKAVSQQDFDDAEAMLKQAEADAAYWKASVESARINFEYAKVESPISGRIGKSSVTDGAIVTAYQPIPLATIQQLDPIYVDVTQSATEFLRLQHRLDAGLLSQNTTSFNKVELCLADGTRYAEEGTLQFRDVSVDPTTGSVTLRMVFPNPGSVLLPGMFVRAVVKEGANERAILVPQQAVSRDPRGNPLVMVVNGQGLVEQRQIGLERALDDQWLVSSNLAAGDRVIVEGMQKVRPGMPVNAVPFDPNGKPADAPPPSSAQAPSTKAQQAPESK